MLTESTEVVPHTELENLEGHLLKLPQVECPVVHHFGPGIYIREALFPAGTLILGHSHKGEHLNMLMQGTILIMQDGKSTTLTAPAIFTAQPGRKIGYALTDVVWQNIYATEERDLNKIEDQFIEKSGTWLDYQDQLAQLNLELKKVTS